MAGETIDLLRVKRPRAYRRSLLAYEHQAGPRPMGLVKIRVGKKTFRALATSRR